MSMKKCKKCLQIKGENEYYISGEYKGKKYYSSICIECAKEKRNSYHQVNKDRDNKRSERYNKKNKDTIKKYKDAYGKQYQKKAKDKYGLSIGTLYNYGFKTCLDVYERADRKCGKCGSVNNLTIHHKDSRGLYNYKKDNIPMNNNLKNLQVLCRSCHCRLHVQARWDKIKNNK